MEINGKIYNVMRRRNNMITTAEVAELGLSRMMLSKYVDAGLLLRVRQGIYALPSEVYDDMFTLMQRSQNIFFRTNRHCFWTDCQTARRLFIR